MRAAATVRNPLLALPAAQALQGLPPEARAALRALLEDLAGRRCPGPGGQGLSQPQRAHGLLLEGRFRLRPPHRAPYARHHHHQELTLMNTTTTTSAAAAQLRQRILHHLRQAVRLGWSTRLGHAAREFAALLRARLVLLRAAS